LRLNGIDDPKLALMSYITGTGQRKLLAASKFMERCNAIWQKQGHQKLTGHSFHIGGMTHYLINKVNPDVV
jgi:hypothetical protein